jgi:hypothetical protein
MILTTHVLVKPPSLLYTSDAYPNRKAPSFREEVKLGLKLILYRRLIMTLREAIKIVETAGYSVRKFPIERDGAVFSSVEGVQYAFQNNIIDVWESIDILVEAGFDRSQASTKIGDWNGGSL